MEYIWWKQMTKPRRLAGDAVSCLLQGQSAVLTLPACTPWKRTLYEVTDELLRQSDSEHNPVLLPCPDEEPGRYLLEHFCEEDRQMDYRFGKTYACFLAGCRDIILHNRYFWVSDIPEDRLQQWLDFAADYDKNRPAGEKRAGFILETEHLPEAFRPARGIPVLSYRDYIGDYDRFTFCAVACTEMELDPGLQPYLSELAFAVCGEDIELCADVIRQGEHFMEAPAAVLASIAAGKSDRDEAVCSKALTSREMRGRVWECQVRLLFPIVQRFVNDFTARYRTGLEANLPMESAFGQVVTNPEDLEVGTLWWMAEHRMLAVEPEDHMRLDLFRRVRNELAHNTPVSYEDVRRTLSRCPVQDRYA